MPLTLRAIICGVANSGTTLLLDLLKAHPDVYSQFEVGFLEAETLSVAALTRLRGTNPSFASFCKHHGVTDADFEAIVAGQNWRAAYQRLLDRCAANRPTVGARSFFVDKTPAYALHLDQVHERIGSVPVVALIRDPRGVYASYRKRAEAGGAAVPLDQFVELYRSYYRALVAAWTRFPHLLLVRFEDLVTDPAAWMPVVCRHIGLSYDALVTDLGASRGRNVNSYDRVYPGKATEYRAVLSPDEQEALLERLDRFRWLAYQQAVPGDPAPPLPPGLRIGDQVIPRS
ncbi:MAG: sulfotransferase family protein [Planctomycetota bacterium]|jgi:hypothetical protein